MGCNAFCLLSHGFMMIAALFASYMVYRADTISSLQKRLQNMQQSLRVRVLCCEGTLVLFLSSLGTTCLAGI